MAQTSPILRFCLEVLHHAMENYASDTPRHRKMAVLNLAQSVELAIKAALVEGNVPIYEKGNRTITPHDGLANIAKMWGVERIALHARVELLIDERNAIQHRYGHIDDVGLDYHMETAFSVLSEILEREFDTKLDNWVIDTVDAKVWRKIRFVRQPTQDQKSPSAALQADRGSTLDLIDGFVRFERRIRERLSPLLNEGESFRGSTLDLVIKALSNVDPVPQAIIKEAPSVFRLRNRVIHGDETPTNRDVKTAFATMDSVLAALDQVPQETLERALRASVRGVKGTRLPTRLEEAQEVFAHVEQPDAGKQDPGSD